MGTVGRGIRNGLVGLLALGAARPTPPTPRELSALIEVLRPLHARLGPPRYGDWLSIHPEKGQSFREYLACEPVLPTAQRRRIYVQPLGRFTPEQRAILDLTVEFMGLYLGLPVVLQPDLPDAVVPVSARRLLPGAPGPQYLTSYVRERLLKPDLPRDAAARIAFTAADLWPGKGWNYVFGEASIGDRVAVWSMHRFGDPAEGRQAYRTCLLRTLSTAVHETCHMFSMRHCTAYECCMCGSENLEEGDRHPLWLCPECLTKLCWAAGLDPGPRYERLGAFCARHGLAREAAFYRRSAQVLKEARWPRPA